MSNLQKTFQHGSLFSGIGGFDLAAEWMGWNNVFSCERDEEANKVLEKRFPNAKHHRDIFDLKAKEYEGRIDILTGGFPCQPFSVAGNRKGESDERHLWPEMLRVISEVKPTYIIGENVTGIINLEDGKTLKKIYADLENQGYIVESFVIPACAVQAWHKRDRIWILAYSDSLRRERRKNVLYSKERRKEIESEGCNKRDGWNIPRASLDSKFIRVFNGLSYWLDRLEGRVKTFKIPRRAARLKQLGNAIVPQVAYEIFKVISHLEAEASKIDDVSE